MHAFVRQLLIGCMAWPHGSGHATQTRCMQCWQACACVWACAFYVLCIRTRVCVCFVCVCVYVAGWVGAVPCARERVPDTKCSFDACIRVPAAHLVDVMDTAAALLRAVSVHILIQGVQMLAPMHVSESTLCARAWACACAPTLRIQAPLCAVLNKFCFV